MKREEQDAAFYESHKDDPTIWREPVEAPEPRRESGLEATIAVRFSADDAGGIRRLAREQGLTYTELVRRAVQDYLRAHQYADDALTRPTSVAGS